MCKGRIIGEAWNVKKPNMRKLQKAKDEMNQMHIDILGISQLRRSATEHIQSKDCIVYFSKQEKQEGTGPGRI